MRAQTITPMLEQAKSAKLPEGRRMILIDVENYNGEPITSVAQARWCRRTLEAWLQSQAGDHIVIAAETAGVTNIATVWPEIRILPGYGEDGAEKRLLEVMEEGLAARFRELVPVSGDGIFTDMVDHLAVQGLPA